ncbi:MAG: hypothetical protein V3W31_07935 [Thermodesulfobacteriota bacterium]
MAITLTSAYLAELKKGRNTPNVVIEVALDGGTRKFGYHTGGLPDVLPVLKSVSSLQNKLDTKGGYSTRGQITVVISGRDNFKELIRDEYLKNRRVTRRDGFVAQGEGMTPFQYADYAATFTGKVLDWSRKGDDLTIVIADELQVEGTKKIPVENSTRTQYLDYRDTNPVDVMQDILKTQLGISASYVDDTRFDSEQSSWMPGWKFDRVLTKPEDANKYLNELQIETNSFIVHDGEKISFKHFAPPMPGQTVEEWNDDSHILKDSFSQKSGYKDRFFNRVVVYYDYDESGGDKPENYESIYIATDASSQSSGEWDEVKTKDIKSKWIRTRTYTQPSNITGVTIYHSSAANGTGSGTLTYNQADNTLSWAAPGGTAGEAVEVTNDGKYQLFDADKTKWARVLVTTASLPAGNQNDTITISSLEGDDYAAYLAGKLLLRYRNPVATVGFHVDINNVAWNSEFRKPADFVDLTTDEASDKGQDGWNKERMMITSLRPDFSASKVQIEAIQTKMYRNYGFIAPAGYPDWDGATDAQKEYAYIGDAADNQLGAGNDPGFYIW